VLQRIAEQFSGEPVDAHVDGQELVVEGDESAQRAARRALEVVERWLGRAWSVDLVELPCGALDAATNRATGSVLSTREVDALLAAYPSAVSTARRATTRRVARFSRERHVPHLYDHDVEVSAIEGVTDPMIVVPRWGRDAVVWLAPHLDGRVLVSCLWRPGEPLGEPRLRQMYGPDHPPIELASGSGSQRAGSAFLEDGVALVLMDGSDERREGGLNHGPLLVRVRAADGNEPGAPDVAFFGLGAGDRPPSWVPGPYLNRPEPSGGWVPFNDSLDGDVQSDQNGAPLFARNALDLSTLLENVRAAWKEAELTGVIERLGTEALAVGPPEALAIACDLLTTRLAPKARSFAVDVRVCVVERNSIQGLTVGAPLPEAHPLLDSTFERRLGVTALGNAIGLTSAHSWMIIGDVDVEIAQAISLGDPVPGVVDSGSSFRAQVVPRIDGRFVLGLQLLERTVAPPPFPTTGTVGLGLATPDGPSYPNATAARVVAVRVVEADGQN